MIQASSLEHSADSLAALFTTATNNTKSDSELRLDVLRWVLDLPPEIDPAHAAQILIGRQSRGESARFADSGQAMLIQLGAFHRGRLAAIPRIRCRAKRDAIGTLSVVKTTNRSPGAD